MSRELSALQLDHTEIAIRKRSTLELYDLALLVLKRHWKPLVLTSLLLAVPFLVIDSLLTAWMLSDDALWPFEGIDAPEVALRWRHGMHLIALYCLQFPLLSLPSVVMLGNLIFYQPMTIRQLVQHLLPIAWRCIFVLGIIRLGLVALALEPLVSRNAMFDWRSELFILVLLPAFALILRAVAPFAAEILGLERCPLRAGKDAAAVTYRRRSSRLHSLLAGEHIGRMLSASGFGALLLLMLLSVQLWLTGIFAGQWQWGWWLDYVGLPFSLWLLGIYFSVFRFLAYVDSRIRLEGWEVELRLRAEGARIDAKHAILTGRADVVEPAAVSGEPTSL